MAVRKAASGLLRVLLPLAVIAAAIVAGEGLFRVVGQPAASPQSGQPPSLQLGTGAPVPVGRPSPATPAPRRGVTERLTRSVVVFNASHITGLAGRTASLLRLRGVSVASIGNLRTALPPATRTVFYPPGDRGQAQVLATLSGAATVAPAPGWLRADGKLVLVVTGASSIPTRS